MQAVVKCKLLFQKLNETDTDNELKHRMRMVEVNLIYVWPQTWDCEWKVEDLLGYQLTSARGRVSK